MTFKRFFFSNFEKIHEDELGIRDAYDHTYIPDTN